MKISEVVYEEQLLPEKMHNNELPQTSTKIFYQSLKDNQITFNNLVSNNNDFNEKIYSQTLD